MSISSEVSRNDYVGTGSVDTYDYTFRIFDESHLTVTTRDSNGLETVLVLNTDYTVTGVGDATGGTIVLTAGNLSSGLVLAIQRILPITQPTDIRNQGEFFPELHEDEFDRLVMIDQQQQDLIDRCLKLPSSESPSDSLTILPAIEVRADTVLGFNSLGEPVAVSGVLPEIIVSAFAETLLDDASASSFLTTLGISSFIQTLLNDADLATAQSTLGIVSLPAGTVMVFVQAAAPTGWTQVITHNGKALRVVSGAGGGSGGTSDPGSTIAMAHTHTTPNHRHDLETTTVANASSTLVAAYISVQGVSGAGRDLGVYANTGADGRAVMQNRTKNEGSGISGSASLNLALAYVDVIIASKD